MVFYFYANRKPDYIRLSSEQKLYYSGLLQKSGLPPVEYVAASLKRHPVVIIGEPHRGSEHYLFVADALGAARAAGASCLAMELFHTSTQKDIDKLLSIKSFNEALARRIVLRGFPGFYYEELVEILKSAWKLNRNGGAFRVLAMGGAHDAGMAALVAKASAGGKKVLVFCGSHHAFTGYRQPGLPEMLHLNKRSRFLRIGGFLINRHGVDAFSIQLHSAVSKRWWMLVPILLYQKGYTLPFSGVLDQVFQQYGKPVGFDSSLGGFATLPDTFSYYSASYDPLELAQYCDGYIYLVPLSAYTAARPLAGIGERHGELDAIREGIDTYFTKPETRQRLKRNLTNKSTLAGAVARSGVTPVTAFKWLDLRGLEDLY